MRARYFRRSVSVIWVSSCMVPSVTFSVEGTILRSVTFYVKEYAVGESDLEPLLLELVKMRASQINGCAYCLDMHSKDARAMGESEQRLYELKAWREAPFYTERERAGCLPGRFRRPRCRPAMTPTPAGYPQARPAGWPDLVYISVVGADRIPIVSRVDCSMFGYFGSKLETERVVVDSGLPWTTLRATQFHDLFLTVARAMAKLPVVPVPAGFRFQPVDADDVAARLVQLTLGEPAGQVPDLGGPRGYTAADLLCGYLHANHPRRLRSEERRVGEECRSRGAPYH